MLFKDSDNPLSGGVVLGDFVDSAGQKRKITGKTSATGAFKIVLPPGNVSNVSARSKDGLVVIPKRGVINIPKVPLSNTLRKTKSIRIEINPSSFASAINVADKVLVLGDISGSMGSGHLMDVLKKSFRDLLNQFMSANAKIALFAWDSWVESCSSAWLDTKDKATAENWINNLRARGGNDMRYAIEHSITVFPDVTNIYIMCDGDISPFTVSSAQSSMSMADVPRPSNYSNESSNTSYQNTPWAQFRNKYPSVNFHFIALGKHSSASDMDAMATIGDGTFFESS